MEHLVISNPRKLDPFDSDMGTDCRDAYFLVGNMSGFFVGFCSVSAHFCCLGRVENKLEKKVREIESKNCLFPLFAFINPAHLPGFVGFLSV